MSTIVSLHIDPEHEYGFTLTLDGRSTHFTELLDPPADDFPVPRPLLAAVEALAYAANTGAITGEQFFDAGQALGLAKYKFPPPTNRPYAFTHDGETFTVEATNSHDAIDEANAHFGLPENFAHWCFDVADLDSNRSFIVNVFAL